LPVTGALSPCRTGKEDPAKQNVDRQIHGTSPAEMTTGADRRFRLPNGTCHDSNPFLQMHQQFRRTRTDWIKPAKMMKAQMAQSTPSSKQAPFCTF
jgi:hypothetical protein